MMNVPINYVAVLVSGVASMVIGFLWYSPALFGKPWMKLSGISTKDSASQKKEMPKTYGLMFVASLVTAYVLSYVVYYSGASDALMGAQVGFWTWLGFIATTLLTGFLFEGKPFKLYLINVGFHLVNLVVMGMILAMWG